MKCKNKKVYVKGVRLLGVRLDTLRLECIVTNDECGKTLSINDGHTQFTIPFEPIEKFLK